MILVTGAAGFLGVSVVERLLAHGHRSFRCLVRPGSRRGRLDAVLAAHSDACVEVVVGSLSNRDDVRRAVAGVDTVLHLAASMKGAAADMVLNTVVASRNLLDALADLRPLRIVLVSSFSVYGVADLPRGALVDESTPLERHPELRDPYTYCKLRQEELFREYRRRHGFELVVLRPGVIYGPGGGHLSARVGFSLFGWFLHLGGSNPLPLTYVENCAEAIVAAGLRPQSAGEVYNVVDDTPPTCRAYLRRYKAEVKPIRSMPVPYAAAQTLARLIERYHAHSRGQLPAVLTRYVTKTLWGGNRFVNDKLRAAGWKQLVTRDEGLRRTFQAFRSA